MKTTGTTLNVRTLGCFRLSINGKPVVTEWPNETIKIIFCTLLSPLDISFSWERICRSMWGIPATQSSTRRMKESFVYPLNSFLIKELGFSPLVSGYEGLRINQQCMQVDAHELYHSVLEGLRQLSLGSHAAARKQFYRADELCIGSYLPGVPGGIIADTRSDLESLCQIARTHAADRQWFNWAGKHVECCPVKLAA